MDSDGDEDFAVSAPTTKKTKKNSGAGEEKGKKKKKESVSKDATAEPASPKRKTPKRKNEPKEETKKGKAKGKAKKSEEENESTAIGEEDDFNDDTENFNLNEESEEIDEDEEFEEKPKKKSVSKSDKKPAKPKKEKAGAAKDSDQDEILEYMKKQNRPYSIINIFDNLHGKIAKKNCQKALDILTEEGQLQAKEFGKNKVWLLNQQNIPQVNAQELAALTEKLNSVKKEHDKLADEVKELNAYLKNLQNQLTNEALSDEIAKYKKLLEESNQKLSQFESGNYPQISDEDMKKAEDKKKQLELECKKRKKMCMEMVNSLAEGMEMKAANIMEMIGLEID